MTVIIKIGYFMDGAGISLAKIKDPIALPITVTAVFAIRSKVTGVFAIAKKPALATQCSNPHKIKNIIGIMT